MPNLIGTFQRMIMDTKRFEIIYYRSNHIWTLV